MNWVIGIVYDVVANSNCKRDCDEITERGDDVAGGFFWYPVDIWNKQTNKQTKFFVNSFLSTLNFAAGSSKGAVVNVFKQHYKMADYIAKELMVSQNHSVHSILFTSHTHIQLEEVLLVFGGDLVVRPQSQVVHF